MRRWLVFGGVAGAHYAASYAAYRLAFCGDIRVLGDARRRVGESYNDNADTVRTRPFC
jgi:hypothetical protein